MEFERLTGIAQKAIGCDESTAEDIVQDVYCELAARRPRIKDYDKYLTSSVAKKAIDYLNAANKGKVVNFTDLGIGPHGEGLAV